MILDISKTTGVGQRTISTTLSEYKKQGTVSSPNKKKVRPTVADIVDDFDKNAIRQKVHSFWVNRQIPTPLKILNAVNEDETLPNFKRSSFHRLLPNLNLVCVKNSRSSALLERNDIVNWRRKYLERIRHYRQEGRPIYFLDETWVNVGEATGKTRVDNTVDSSSDAFLRALLTTGQKKPRGKGKQLIVLHIGSSDGFVPGGLLCFESQTSSADFHYELSGDTFYGWFVKMLPLLKENAVIVMDNAPSHSVKKYQFPEMSWKKQDIINWLENKGEMVIQPIVKSQLLEKVDNLKPQFDKYVIDELARENNKIVLRLPPHHCELNPIEHAWSLVKHYVRTYNTTFKLQDVKELLERGLELVTSEIWTSFVKHVVEEEEKFWIIDFITDELLEAEQDEDKQHIFTITGDTGSESDSDF